MVFLRVRVRVRVVLASYYNYGDMQFGVIEYYNILSRFTFS